MPASSQLSRFFTRILSALLGLVLRFEKPHNLPQRAPEATWVYVFARRSVADRLAADLFLRQHQRPRLAQTFTIPDLVRGDSTEAHPSLQAQVNAWQQGSSAPQWVPITVLWGRSTDAQTRRIGELFADRWATMGAVRTLFMVLFNLRHCQVIVSQPVTPNGDATEQDDSALLSRKIQRVLRVHFMRVRQQALGPDLSHRRTLMRQILNSAQVQQVIVQQARSKRTSEARITQLAQKQLNTMMADVSMPTVRLMDVLLRWLWQRIYGGIQVGGLEQIKAIPTDHTRVYVPCHRSHVDYLLLSYCLHHQGLNLPYIAAGINLNIPIVGALLRRSGAFFMRRSLGGDKLYTTLFHEYVYQMINRGYALEYFVEGGRSRTGRMLPPKLGMLTMTVRSYLRSQLQGRQQPVQLVPVYIGYEKIFEEHSYLNELRGQQKQKETLWGLLRMLRRLRNYGTVSVNFGMPIELGQHLDQHQPNWRDDLQKHGLDRPGWVNPAIQQLGQTVAQRINACAALNPINLLALALLSHPRHALDGDTLRAQLELLQQLQQQVPASPELSLVSGSPQAWIDHALRLNILQSEPQPLGSIYRLEAAQAVLMTYYRNNILHLWTLPSLICNVIATAGLAKQRAAIIAMTVQIDAYVQPELFIAGTEQERTKLAERYLDALTTQGIIDYEDGCYAATEDRHLRVHFTAIRRMMQPTLERYYLTLSTLVAYGAHQLSPQSLETHAQEMAQRMAVLHGLNTPEFFDRNLFRRFIQSLREHSLISLDDANNIEFNDTVVDILMHTESIMDEELVREVRLVTERWQQARPSEH